MTELWHLPWHWGSLAWIAAVAWLTTYALWLGRGASRGQQLAAASAAILFLVSFVSPVGPLADGSLFAAHMVQHLLLLLGVPLLALVAIPDELASRALRHPLVARVARAISWPPLGWTAGLTAMWVWHEPLLCAASFASAPVAILRDATLLGAGLLFWWPVVTPARSLRVDPPSAVAYLFSACLGCTALGIYLTFTPIQVCPIFADAGSRSALVAELRGRGYSVAADQQLGGLLMWVPPCLLYASASLWALSRWYRVPARAEVTP